MRSLTLLIALLFATAGLCRADDAETSEPNSKTVAQIVQETRNSIVVVTPGGRDGDASGMGSGFVIGDNGLIATSLHVIGEARPIWVKTHGG